MVLPSLAVWLFGTQMNRWGDTTGRFWKLGESQDTISEMWAAHTDPGTGTKTHTSAPWNHAFLSFLRPAGKDQLPVSPAWSMGRRRSWSRCFTPYMHTIDASLHGKNAPKESIKVQIHVPIILTNEVSGVELLLCIQLCALVKVLWRKLRVKREPVTNLIYSVVSPAPRAQLSS